MKTLKEILEHCTTFLEKKGINKPKLQAELVISGALGYKRLDLYMDLTRPVTAEESSIIKERIKKRGSRTPVGYIEGRVVFDSCIIEVSPSVLIPRQETEILIEKIAAYLEKQDLKDKCFVDACSGSGCIAIAIKKRFPNLKVIGTDICLEALAVAKKNAKKNGVEIQWEQTHLIEDIKNIDYLVCNPPYISENDWHALEPEVKDFEPKKALVGGPTGLELYEALVQQIPTRLQPSGSVWLEIGYDQGKSMEKIFESLVFSKKSILQDYSSKDRFFFLERWENTSYSNGDFLKKAYV